MSEFEAWSVVIGVVGLGVTVGLGLFGKGFTRWATVVDESARALDSRLKNMANKEDERHKEMSVKLAQLQAEFHRLQVCVERRMTRIETKVEDP